MSHADVAERDAHGAEQLFRLDTVGIPFRDGVIGFAKFVFFSVRECESLFGIFYFQFAFRFNTINRLVVEHTAVVLEE